jgi:hypothetical protein
VRGEHDQERSLSTKQREGGAMVVETKGHVLYVWEHRQQGPKLPKTGSPPFILRTRRCRNVAMYIGTCEGKEGSSIDFVMSNKPS